MLDSSCLVVGKKITIKDSRALRVPCVSTVSLMQTSLRIATKYDSERIADIYLASRKRYLPYAPLDDTFRTPPLRTRMMPYARGFETN